MVAPASRLREDLFQERLIASYVDDPLFAPRDELVNHLAALSLNPANRIVLITGEPGEGKSALLAALARKNPTYLRYFLRYDSQTPYRANSAIQFLLSIGRQLQAIHPALFQSDQLRVTVEEEIERIAVDGSAQGLRIGRLRISPFCQYVIDVKLRADVVAGALTGVEIEQIEDAIRDPAILAQFALYGPAAALRQQQPDELITILIDALDELRDTELSLLNWLRTCGEPPANVRFIIASRPGLHLTSLRQPWTHTVSLTKSVNARANVPQVYAQAPALTLCAQKYVARPEIAGALRAEGMDAQTFARDLVAKADENFLYLRALQRMIEQAIGASHQLNMLRLNSTPGDVKALYISFLNSVFDRTQQSHVDIGQGNYLREWGIVSAILGLLAVAREPLSVPEIKRLGQMSAPESAIGTLVRATLAPLLTGNQRGYALYHRTLAEFLTDPETAERNPQFYHDRIAQNRQIVASYLGDDARTQPQDIERIDHYGMRQLAEHLLAAGDAERLHALVTTAPLRDRWLARHLTLEGSSAGYLDDIELLWEHVTSDAGWDVARQPQYTVLRSSVLSRVAVAAPAILPLLIETRQRTAGAALSDALQVSDDGQRTRLLMAVAEYLSPIELTRAWEATERIEPASRRLAARCALLRAQRQAPAARVQAVWEAWRDQWEQAHANTSWVSALDEHILIEQVSQIWDALPGRTRNSAMQAVIAARSPRNVVYAMCALAAVADQAQRAWLFSPLRALLADSPALSLELVSLGALLGEDDRAALGGATTAVVARSWANLRAMTDAERTEHAQEVAILAPFLSRDAQREAVGMIERMTKPQHQVYALFAILPVLPEPEQTHARGEAQALVARMFTEQQNAALGESLQRIESLIGLLGVLTEQQREALLTQAMALPDKRERSQALYDIAQHWRFLPEDARQRLAKTFVSEEQQIGGEIEAAEALLEFATSATDGPAREQATESAERLIARLTDRTQQGLALLALATVRTGERQASLVRQAMASLNALTPEGIAKLLTEPSWPRERLTTLSPLLPRDVQAALKRERGGVSAQMAKRGPAWLPGWLGRDAHEATERPTNDMTPDAYLAALRAALAAPPQARVTRGWLDQLERLGEQRQQAPSDLIADVVTALLSAVGEDGDTPQRLATVRLFTAHWDGAEFFKREERRRVWKATLRAWAALERSDCLLAMRFMLAVAPRLLSPAEQEQAITGMVDVLQWLP